MKKNLKSFEGWECDCCRYNSNDYDSLVYEFQEVLKNYSITGYHCTRLTDDEIESILSNGMFLQDSISLKLRIDRLLQSGFISSEIADSLKNNNQADDTNRANMLWFCFFYPFLGGEYGIRRFFRSWGGEALYKSHEGNRQTGEVLRNIGSPCIVKANIPISSLKKSKFPDGPIVRVLLSESGHTLKIPIEHEGYSIQNIEPQNIVEIFKYPTEEFIKLTKCNEWSHDAI